METIKQSKTSTSTKKLPQLIWFLRNVSRKGNRVKFEYGIYNRHKTDANAKITTTELPPAQCEN